MSEDAPSDPNDLSASEPIQMPSDAEVMPQPATQPEKSDYIEFMKPGDMDRRYAKVDHIEPDGTLRVVDRHGRVDNVHSSEVTYISPRFENRDDSEAQARLDTVEDIGDTAVDSIVAEPSPVAEAPPVEYEPTAGIPISVNGDNITVAESVPVAVRPPESEPTEMDQAQEVKQAMSVIGSVFGEMGDKLRRHQEAFRARAQELGIPVKDLPVEEMNRIIREVLPSAEDAAKEPPAPSPDAELKYDSPKRGVWRSQGPQGQDNPEADVVGEATYTDGRKFYRMRNPQEPGKEWYAPADEVEIVSSATQPENVSVKRTSGEVENDWSVRYRKDGIVVVSKPDTNGKTMEKGVPFDEFNAMNPDFKFPGAQTVPPEFAPETEKEPTPTDDESNESPDAKEADTEPELDSATLKSLQESIDKTQAEASRIETLLEETVGKARQAMTEKRFDDANNLVNHAKRYRTALKLQIKRLSFLKKKYNQTRDLLNPANILELKDKYDSQIQKERERRRRLQDDEPMDDYIEMVKRHLLERYFQTGADPGRPRNIPPELMQEVMASLDQSRDNLQSSLSKNRQPVEAPKTPEPAGQPKTEPEVVPVANVEPDIANVTASPGEGDRIPDGVFDSSAPPTGNGTATQENINEEEASSSEIDLAAIADGTSRPNSNTLADPNFLQRFKALLERQPTWRRRTIKVVGFIACANALGAPLLIYYHKGGKPKKPAPASTSLPVEQQQAIAA